MSRRTDHPEGLVGRHISHRKERVSCLSKGCRRAAVTWCEPIKGDQALRRRLTVVKPGKVDQLGAKTTATAVLGQSQRLLHHRPVVVQHALAVQQKQFCMTNISSVALSLQSWHNINFGCASFLNQLQQTLKHQLTTVMQQASCVTKDQYRGCRLGHGFILSSRLKRRPSCRKP